MKAFKSNLKNLKIINYFRNDVVLMPPFIKIHIINKIFLLLNFYLHIKKLVVK